MHELGIVYHIIRDVENVARANGVSRVSSVTLLLGEVSGVVPDLLLDAWRWAADKKPITEGAELIVEPVEAVTHQADRDPRRGPGRRCPRRSF